MKPNPLELVHEMGQDADLLMQSDEALENARKDLATQIDLLCGQLSVVLAAQKCKRQLQQTNRVAVRLIERNNGGQITDVKIKVMPLKDALALLERSNLDGVKPEDAVLERAHTEAQVYVWSKDGYDIETTQSLMAK